MKPCHMWLIAEVNSILSDCREKAPWLRCHVTDIVEKQVKNLLVDSVPDDVFGRKPGMHSKYWDIAEQKATVAMAAQMGTPVKTTTQPREHQALPWTARNYDRNFYFNRLLAPALKDTLLLNPLYRWHPPETSFLRDGNTFWALGVVCWEAAMRSSMRASGFGLSGGIGEFWSELDWHKRDQDSFVATIPVWRWQLLREAYLVSFIWGLTQLLFSDWTPFDHNCRRYLGKAMSSISATYGWAWGLRKDLRWNGCSVITGTDKMAIEAKAKEIIGRAVSSETAFHHYDRDWCRCPERLRYGHKTFTVDPAQSGQIWGAAAPFTLIDRPGCFRLDRNGSWTADAAVKFDPFAEFHGNQHLLGLETPEEISAHHLLQNLFLASHSRYASLQMGCSFKKLVEQGDLPDSLVQIFAQFGLLTTSDWLATPSLALLFDGAHLGPSARNLLVRRPLGLVDFTKWSALRPQDIHELWTNVDQAPLSYPLVPPDPSPNRDCMWAIKWVERTLRASAHGLCPFSLLPINQNPYPMLAKHEADAFLAWRKRIWSPIFGPKLPTKWRPLTDGEWRDGTNGILSAHLESLYLTWIWAWV
ncbi:MAG: hypothetical protein ACLQVY_01365 [Limisphaerales bacterium]